VPDFDQHLTRRSFIATSCALTAGWVSGCATTTAYRLPTQNGRITINLTDHPELAAQGGIIVVRSESLEDGLIVIHQAPNNFTALSSACTHLQCTVRPAKHALICPCHGSTFDLSGHVVRGPAEKPLKTYPAQFVNNTVQIQVSDKGASP
jgi:Rieske Fe-S protein